MYGSLIKIKHKNKMQKETIKISGMTCNHCIKSVEDAIKQLPVNKYEVELGSLYVEYDQEKLTEQQISEAIEESGYEIIH